MMEVKYIVLFGTGEIGIKALSGGIRDLCAEKGICKNADPSGSGIYEDRENLLPCEQTESSFSADP